MNGSKIKRAFRWLKEHEPQRLAIEYGFKTAVLTLPMILYDYFDTHFMAFYAFDDWSRKLFGFLLIFYGLFLFLPLWFIPFGRRGGSKAIKLLKYVFLPCELFFIPDMIMSLYFGEKFFFFNYIIRRLK